MRFASKEIVYVYDEKPEVIGRLAISLTDARLQSAAQERMFLAGVLAAILLVSVVFSALLGNRRTIGIPLERLLASINRSRAGGERQAVDWRSNDEIGAVVSAFNEMQDRQNAYERELEEARDMLERRVEERTRELDRAQRILVDAETTALILGPAAERACPVGELTHVQIRGFAPPQGLAPQALEPGPLGVLGLAGQLHEGLGLLANQHGEGDPLAVGGPGDPVRRAGEVGQLRRLPGIHPA